MRRVVRVRRQIMKLMMIEIIYWHYMDDCDYDDG